MIAVTSTSASGVALPPAANIGPNVVASEKAGPIAAAAISSRSPKPRTRRTRLGFAQTRVAVTVGRVERDADDEPDDEANPGGGPQPRHDEDAEQCTERRRDQPQRRAKRSHRVGLAQPEHEHADAHD